ncbi:MAG TPA: glycerophosphodiester phosphodiesterase [Acidobacteriota bacterium]|nr:glycerophosphodiester phosphodiesterase [Acidobacteriota bacterium]
MINHRPQIVAHRGASQFCRENTMAAFQRGLADGADTIECDLRLTADRRWVIRHDADIPLKNERLRIADLTVADLGKVVPAAGIDPLPTLTELLDWTRAERLRPVLDIKDTTGIPELIAEIEAAGLSEPPVFSSFRRSILREIRQQCPTWPTALIVGNPRYRLVRRLMFGSFLRWAQTQGVHALHLHERWITPGIVEAIRRAGLKSAVWTVNNPMRVTLLAMLGVDSIITDRPDLARPAVEQSNPTEKPSSAD